MVSQFQKRVDHIVVCGYTKVTESIVDELKARNASFPIIEERENLVPYLKNRGFDVLQGDPAEQEVLRQANLPGAAALIAATDSDAANTLVALTARAMRETGSGHPFRIVVRLEDEENIGKVESLGVDEIISPSTLGGRLMARRALGASEDETHG